MRLTARRAALALAFCLAAGSAFAQGSLRIGLGDDPDGLDPTTSRFYTTRIVFAALCDKLFDIDEKAGIVPQLALGAETSADGKTVTIKLRPGVKFHDGEPFTAEAAKYSLERHMNMKGSFRKPELAAVDSVEVADPLTVKLNLKQPFSPLLAQLTDRAGMMVSPKAAEAAGDKFALKPVCAGPYKFVERVAQDRIVLEKFPDYWNKDQRLHRQDHLPADRRFDRASGEPAFGRAGHDGARCWRPTSRRCATIPSSGSARRCRWASSPCWSTSPTGPRPTIRWARIRACARPSISRSTARR